VNRARLGSTIKTYNFIVFINLRQQPSFTEFLFLFLHHMKLSFPSLALDILQQIIR
jgi:hypothetical protein